MSNHDEKNLPNNSSFLDDTNLLNKHAAKPKPIRKKLFRHKTFYTKSTVEKYKKSPPLAKSQILNSTMFEGHSYSPPVNLSNKIPLLNRNFNKPASPRFPPAAAIDNPAYSSPTSTKSKIPVRNTEKQAYKYTIPRILVPIIPVDPKTPTKNGGNFASSHHFLSSQSSECNASIISTPTKPLTPGPFRATKLWKSLIKYFVNKMPTKKHRSGFGFRYLDNTFTGSEAVDFLHTHHSLIFLG